LSSFVHPRHFTAGENAFFATLSSPEVRKALRQEIETTKDWENWYKHVGSNWDNVLISAVGPKGDRTLEGLSVQQVADRRKVDVWDAVFDLIQHGDPFVSPKT